MPHTPTNPKQFLSKGRKPFQVVHLSDVHIDRQYTVCSLCLLDSLRNSCISKLTVATLTPRSELRPTVPKTSVAEILSTRMELFLPSQQDPMGTSTVIPQCLWQTRCLKLFNDSVLKLDSLYLPGMSLKISRFPCCLFSHTIPTLS